MKNSSISIDSAIAEAGSSNSAPVNSNPPSFTDLGSGVSSAQSVPASPSNPGVAKSTDPQWDSNRTNGDWSGVK